MCILAVDIGNTRAKWAIFQHKKLIHQGVFIPQKEYIQWMELRDNYPIQKVIYASVRTEKPQWLLHIEQEKEAIAFSIDMPSPIQNQYRDKKTLGLDRWAAVLGTHLKYAQQCCMIVDAGTCMTIDLLSENQVYHGGTISPGVQMRLQAMHQFTEKLPLVAVNWEVPLVCYGKNTQEAIRAGAIGGCVAEIMGWYEQYKKEFDTMKIVITGGDGVFLYNQLKSGIFAHHIYYEPYLVLEGICSVLQ